MLAQIFLFFLQSLVDCIHLGALSTILFILLFQDELLRHEAIHFLLLLLLLCSLVIHASLNLPRFTLFLKLV